MKTLFSSKKNHYLKAISIFLIAVMLIVGAVSCEGEGEGEGEPDTYSLTMAVNPTTGGTAVDVTGASPYEASTDVDIEATPAAGYDFVMWTAPAGSFADSNSATTRFTMPAQDVTVTAHFVGPIDHFRCYFVNETTATNVSEEVKLDDLFVSINTTVWTPYYFCNPTEKVHDDVVTPISNPDHHFTMYTISYPYEHPFGWWSVVVDNQFGEEQELLVYGPGILMVPTQKVVPGGHEPPLKLDHYLVYEVWDAPSVPDSMVLSDQFITGQHASNRQATGFLTPVRKMRGTEITDPLNWDQYFTVYDITVEPESFRTDVETYNQFGSQGFAVTDEATPLLVPSTMLYWEPTTPPLP